MATPRQSRHLKKAFLDSFRQHGNVSRACRDIKLCRATLYVWKEHDADFMMLYEVAEVEATERLEEAAYERAVQGVTQETPIFHRGKQIDTVVKTEYSDTLLIFLLKARNPEKYRDNITITHQIRSEAERIAAKLGKTVDEVLAGAGVSLGR